MASRLSRFFSPQSMVAIGGHAAEQVIFQTQKLGYQGQIYAVHPTKKSVLGVTCYPDVMALPKAPDAAFIGIPNTETVTVVNSLAEINCGGAVCYASGFAEHDAAGANLQQTLLTNAKDMPIIGPNCYGMLNTDNCLALWPDYHGLQPLAQLGVDKGAAIITQSGNVGINFTMQKRGLPISYLISTGNQAGLDIADYIQILSDLPAVSVIGLHIESLKNISHFQTAVNYAATRRVSIVCIKSGSSSLAAQAIKSHTSSIAGEDSFYQALFDALGITRVDSLDVFIETMKLLLLAPTLIAAKPSIATISCSGGEASLAADTADRIGLDLPAMQASQLTQLKAVLGDWVDCQNPLDYHTFIWGQLDKQTDCFAAVHRGQQTISCKLLDFPDLADDKSTSWQITLDAYIAAVKRVNQQFGYNKPAAVISGLSESLPQSIMTQLISVGIVPLCGLESGLQAIAAATRVQFISTPRALLFHPPVSKPTQTSDEYQAKQLVASLGLNIPNSIIINTTSSWEISNINLRYPLVAKILSNKIAHKSDIGGVKLNISTPDELQQAVDSLRTLTPVLLIEEMAEAVQQELILRIKFDPLFGTILNIGLGGVFIELLADLVTLILPTNEDEIHDKLAQLKCYPLLSGYRQQAGIDLDALVSTILTLQNKLSNNPDLAGISEIEINPLLVCESGFVVADALIIH